MASREEEEVPNQKEEYARLMRELDELEKQHAGLRQYMAQNDGGEKTVIEHTKKRRRLYKLRK